MGAYLDVDLDAVAQNWQYFNEIAPDSLVAGVIKANSYGLGANKVAHKLQDVGCNHYFVANLKEAIEARQAVSASSAIFVLGGFFDKEIEYFREFDITPVINSVEQLKFLQNSDLKVALHIDTGMNRLGLRPEEAAELANTANKMNLALVMSHLVSSSERNNPMNDQQLKSFTEVSALFDAPKSLSASGGALLGREFQFDLIRPGIGLYGGAPITDEVNSLKTVASLYAPIAMVRDVKSGETIGYDGIFTAANDMHIATIDLGYADGFLRSGSNKGMTFVDDTFCPILGRVSMDLIAIDISNCKQDLKCGDYVEMFGNNVKIDELAKAMNTISYEILTRMGHRIKRNYLGEI